MVTVSGSAAAGASKLAGQNSQKADTADRFVRHINGERIRFRDLALFAWPEKAEANLAFLLGVDARTARRWLAGDTEPPADALGVILAEIMKRFHQR